MDVGRYPTRHWLISDVNDRLNINLIGGSLPESIERGELLRELRSR